MQPPLISSSTQARFPERLGWMLALAAATVLLPLIAVICLEQRLAWPCPFLTMTGLPCPFCGTTRAFAELTQFNFVGALKFNPLAVVSLAGLAGAPLLMRFTEERKFWIVCGSLLGVNWVYLMIFLTR